MLQIADLLTYPVVPGRICKSTCSIISLPVSHSTVDKVISAPKKWVESDEYSQDMKLAFSSAPKIAFASAVLVLAASLLLGACADSNTEKKDDPHFFGAAGGANGAGAATGGMSFSW